MDKKFLSQYLRLEQCIEETKKEIEKLEKKPPIKECDIVKGSMEVFPYTERSFVVSGYGGPSYDRWQKKFNALNKRLTSQVETMIESKLKVENFIQDIPDIETRLIFKYTYMDGMKQEDVARNMGMEQSTVSKRITAYLNSISIH